MLSEMTGMELKDEYDLMEQLRDLSQMQKKYGTVMKAMDMVRSERLWYGAGREGGNPYGRSGSYSIRVANSV